MEKQLTVREVADRLQYGINKVYQLIEAGELPASNLSSGSVRPNWRVSVNDLDRFLAERKNTNNG